MSLRRGGTPLMGAVPSLEASNQAQIEDLVQRNRTLEHTNKKLVDEIAREQVRAKEAMLDMTRKWEATQAVWKEGCEDILASYRIVQKQLEVEVEKERSAVIKEMSITREEKLQRVTRDFKITLFQLKEEEMERKIEELEEEKANLVEEFESALRQEKERSAEISSKLREARESLARSIKEKEEKEAKFNNLVAKHSNLQAAEGTLDSKRQRAELQLQGAQTKILEFERLNDELRRTNADLTHQLERWQTLDTKGGEAAEKEHQKRITLEFELHELKEIHKNQLEEYANLVEKLKNRHEKMKDKAATYEDEAKQQEKEANEANKLLAKLEKQVDKLKQDLEVERARVRPPSPQKPRLPTPPPRNESEPGESGGDTSQKDDVKTKKPLVQVARKKINGKRPQPVQKTAAPEESDVEISEPNVEALEGNPAPTKRRPAKSKPIEIEDEDATNEPSRPPRKRKAVEDVEIIDEPKAPKKGSRAPSQVKETGKAKAKPRSRAGSKQPMVREEEVDEGGEEDPTGPKKKKRKIFPSQVAPGPFAFGSLGQFDDRGLGIPSILSPVREDVPIPQRSTSSSLVSKVGSLFKRT
ncbi:hypothetical protein M413DRAFT_446748 [Hebeloma cylindrosporum]|uniref:Uncharacterized protein n=1 Tax=Hebeloma cylindrosporum TaxID=76867 RepID=A0A0C2XQC5_HEBCY|nr:hypothetical protein M413DRAFT_446748 [Hebeloma cylindrosporum h7]